MRLTKTGLESNPCFMDKRKTIPGLDGFSELVGRVDNIVCLGDCLRVRIGTVCHVSVFEKVFDIIENIFHRVDWVIVYFGHFLF